MEQGTGDWDNPAHNNKHSHCMCSEVKLTGLAITCTMHVLSILLHLVYNANIAYLKVNEMQLSTELLMCHVHLHVEGHSEDSILLHLKIHTNCSLVVALKNVPAVPVHTRRGRPDHVSCERKI